MKLNVFRLITGNHYIWWYIWWTTGVFNQI